MYVSLVVAVSGRAYAQLPTLTAISIGSVVFLTGLACTKHAVS